MGGPRLTEIGVKLKAERAVYRRWAKRARCSRRKCIECGGPIPQSAQKFCSEACSNSYYSAKARRQYQTATAVNRKPTECRECGVIFTPDHAKRTVFCSAECYRKHWHRIKKSRERARLRGAMMEPVDPIKVFERDSWRCQLCLCKTMKAKRGTRHPWAPEMDHIIPLSNGGEHSYRNTQCACHACNHKKSNGPGGQLRLFGLVADINRGIPCVLRKIKFPKSKSKIGSGFG
ncbi:hypothetical protein LCGC14_1840280 [marine sediment metagenome]|uniref:HNH nuclease domain-containing protein n=1 Tax=marine sediment metagenome TaxID=412755 RepID=A0A0F9ISV8_9ZZZZ